MFVLTNLAILLQTWTYKKPTWSIIIHQKNFSSTCHALVHIDYSMISHLSIIIWLRFLFWRNFVSKIWNQGFRAASLCSCHRSRIIPRKIQCQHISVGLMLLHFLDTSNRISLKIWLEIVCFMQASTTVRIHGSKLKDRRTDGFMQSHWELWAFHLMSSIGSAQRFWSHIDW